MKMKKSNQKKYNQIIIHNNSKTIVLRPFIDAHSFLKNKSKLQEKMAP